MYKRFVRESSELEPFRAQCESSGAHGNPEVDDLWARIDARNRRQAFQTAAQEPKIAGGSSDLNAAARARYQWGTVRIFISSTFKDFFAERESLVKRVFPSLREWCEKRRIALYDYDLRWGVPKDSTSSEAVRTCLELLDRCQTEAGGRVFFLGLVGDRFGWVPGPADLDEELQLQYDWTFGSSVTQMEVVHGAMAKLSPNALFMVRDSACYADIPDAQRKDFVEPAGSVTARHVARQKLELAKRFPPSQVRLYSVRYAGSVKEGKRERVQFSGFEEFERQVLTFFQKTIAAEFPLHVASEPPEEPVTSSEKPTSEAASDSGESNETHICYMFALAGNAQGQTACLNLMRDFASADDPDASKLPPLFGDLEEASETSGLRALAICGDTGAGKSTVLARLGQLFVDKKGFDVMAHFSQFSPTSGDAQALRKKLRDFFLDFVPKENVTAITKDTSVENILELVSKITSRRFIVLIDAYECFFESSHPRDLLPAAWPANVRCILTCHKSEAARCFGDRVVHLYNLEPLEPEACRAVCRGYLDAFGKRLDAAQLTSLLGKASATNPLWLTQACEELRVFGDYAALSQMIANFPDDTHELLKTIGARILKDDKPDGLVATLLSLVSVSRVGLWEKHARRLLHFASNGQETKDESENDEVPLAEYLRLRRETKAFLRSIARESTCLTFQHRASRAAVQELLLAEPEAVIRWHSLVANFILSRLRNGFDAVLSRDLPHHLYYCDRRSELHKILSFDQSSRHIAIRIPTITSSYVYNSWRCRQVKVTPESKQASLVVCTFCKNLPTRVGTLRSAGCAYCGMMIMRGHSVPAGTCQMHQAPHASMLRCWFCGRTDSNAAQLSICSMCNNMSSPMWCCQPVLETDRQFRFLQRGQTKRSNLFF
ncbi:hypothetical protein BOX15_Mlig012051g3 [Macrostomum lignano]|uniref:AAA+ ATPase domain-containing protein n=1 Tax=Macrostomum lignano TaxID=282301 RepID=A0A267FXV2_9PLAT|nr:hypothetical protein BOX15_Mlig012051g3 [Macrostomum lignano]